MIPPWEDPCARSRGCAGWAERRQSEVVLAASAGTRSDVARMQAAAAAKANRHIPASLSHSTGAGCHQHRDGCRPARRAAQLLANLSHRCSSPEKRQDGSFGYEEAFVLE